jgi:hypothetical protein
MPTDDRFRRPARAAPSLAASAALIALILLAACATAPTGADAVRTTPIPDGDARAVAEWVRQACDARAMTRADCREAAVVRVAEERGIAAAMTVIALLDAGDGEGHVLTHMVGISGFEGGDRVAESFAQCTPIHQSGCYHGVIQAYFAELREREDASALSAARLDALCAPYAGPEGDRWLHFQCLHGMGHGLMLVHDNHLPRALEACDLLSAGWDREVCYGGAFMENVMTIVAPHHDHVGGVGTDPDAAGHDDHAPHAPGHDHHGAHAGHDGHAADDFPALDPEDLHYPCSALDSRYHMACYDMQTAAMLHFLDNDVAAAAAACRDAPDPTLRAVCHRSLGRDINALSNGVHSRSATLCARAATPDRPACHTGVVKNVIDVTADAGSGLAYCRLVPTGPERQACYRAIGEQVAVLMPDPAERVQFCRALDGTDRTACAEGAGVRAGL